MSALMFPESSHRLVCAHCQDVIGVYEPMIVAGPHPPRETSIAAEPTLADSAGVHFHAACFARRGAIAATDGP